MPALAMWVFAGVGALTLIVILIEILARTIARFIALVLVAVMLVGAVCFFLPNRAIRLPSIQTLASKVESGLDGVRRSLTVPYGRSSTQTVYQHYLGGN